MKFFNKFKPEKSQIKEINEKLKSLEEDFINLNIHINLIRNELFKEIQEIKTALISKI
jgi:molecular chaperone GrpE (heat shock protein)